MSSEVKAKKFAAEAEQHGWTATIKSPADEEVHVYCERGSEKIHVWWRDNSLIETPKYTIGGGAEISLHNNAAAVRQLSVRVDPKLIVKRMKRGLPKTRAGQDAPPIVRHPLPFDIHTSSDADILKACRGARISWLRADGQAETSMIPYKIVHKGTTRLMNVDLVNVFYLAEGRDERAYISFMDPDGTFRAVYLDRILQVS